VNEEGGDSNIISQHDTSTVKNSNTNDPTQTHKEKEKPKIQTSYDPRQATSKRKPLKKLHTTFKEGHQKCTYT